MATKTPTGTADDQFDLISVVYHALKGASAAERYLHDARQVGDPDEIQFFTDVERQHRDIAERGKTLMSTRLNRTLVR